MIHRINGTGINESMMVKAFSALNKSVRGGSSEDNTTMRSMFHLRDHQALILDNWNGKDPEVQFQQFFNQFLIFANLLLILGLMCCLLIARWLNASGCIHRGIEEEFLQAATMRVLTNVENDANKTTHCVGKNIMPKEDKSGKKEARI